jgi:two-component system, LytTR family, sensor kinase
MRSLRSLHLAFVGFWGVCAVLASLAFWTQVQIGSLQVRGFEPRMLEVMRMQAGAWIAAAIATPMVTYWSTRFWKARWPVAAAAHTAGACVFVAASTLVNINAGLLLRGLAPQLPETATFIGRAAGSLALLVTEYAVIVGVTIAFHSHHDALERASLAEQLGRARVTLERDLAAARLLVLRQQLQPHFLFNALNAVSGMIDTDPVAARRMLARIGDLLRVSLDRGAEAEATLGDELDFVDRYLAVERSRLGDRLRVAYKAPPDLLQMLLPSFALQPLVENAVRHGVAMLPAGGAIEISATSAGNGLEVRICNDAPSIAESRPEGIGLGSLRERLCGLYGDAGRLTARPLADGRFEVLLRVPARLEERPGVFVGSAR